jgi:hypothetical protein
VSATRARRNAESLDVSGFCALTSPQLVDTYRPLFGRR